MERAAAKVYAALSLTDKDSESTVVRAHVDARVCGVHVIVGSEVLYHSSGGNGRP